MRRRELAYVPGTEMTQRSAETLVRFFGLGTIEGFAEGLPASAKVLDVGAGGATFGHTVCGLRPDISWTNFDKDYRKEGALEIVRAGAPDNLNFISGNIADGIPFGKYDKIFSYFAFNYVLGDAGKDLTSTRILQMIRQLTPIGSLALGPLSINKIGDPSFGRAACTATVSALDNTRMEIALAEHLTQAILGPPNYTLALQGVQYVHVEI